VVVIDETGFPKQGTHSAGVARQDCGALGKIGNCQVGVFLTYAGTRGHTLLHRFAERDLEAVHPQPPGFALDLARRQRIEEALDRLRQRPQA